MPITTIMRRPNKKESDFNETQMYENVEGCDFWNCLDGPVVLAGPKPWLSQAFIID